MCVCVCNTRSPLPTLPNRSAPLTVIVATLSIARLSVYNHPRLCAPQSTFLSAKYSREIYRSRFYFSSSFYSLPFHRARRNHFSLRLPFVIFTVFFFFFFVYFFLLCIFPFLPFDVYARKGIFVYRELTFFFSLRGVSNDGVQRARGKTYRRKVQTFCA